MNTIDERFELSVLITRYLSEGLDEDGLRKLETWLQESEQHQQLFDRLKSDELRRQKIEAYRRIDTGVALKGFMLEKSRRRQFRFRRRMLRIVEYAAILILPIVAVWYFYPDSEGHSPMLVENSASAIRAGKTRAILTLATGEVMKLSAEGTKQIQGNGQVIIRNDSGCLEYRMVEKVASEKEQYNMVAVPRGGEYALVLSDGTKVWLNADSRLKYPVAFLGEQRQVYLEGEAYFEVSKDKKHQFIVTTERASVLVYGTSFNVMDYADESEMAVTLVNGSVGINTTANKQQMVLVPGEQAILADGRLSREKVDVERYVAWRKGKIAYVSTSLEDMLRQLSRWYDVNVTFVREESKHILFSGEIIKYDDFNEVLDVIQSTQEIKVKVEGKTVIIY